MQKKFIITLVVVMLAGVGWYVVAGGSGSNSSQTRPSTGTRVGESAPSFTMTTIDGKTVTSDSLRGKVVVLSSAAQWCPTCQEEAREFAPVYQRYKDKPVVFITIDIDPRDTDASIEQFRTTYNTLWDYTDAQGGSEIIQKYGMNRFEMTVVIDQNGVLRFNGDVLTRPDALDAEIKKLL